MVYDLIVAGSGSVGAAAGWYASRAGLKVLMIDRGHPPHREGSHHGESRLIRHAYGEGAAYVPMVLRAQKLWDELETQCGERIMQRSGVVNIAPETSEFITNIRQSALAFSLPVELMSQTDMVTRWPQLDIPEGYAGVFEASAGYLRSDLAVRHLIRLARESGAAQLFNCSVDFLAEKDGLQQVETAEGTFYGRKLLISCGTWVKTLLPALPIAPVRKVFAWHQADGRYSENNRFPAFTVETPDGSHYYGFPAENNAIKIGKHDGGQSIASPQQRTPFGSEAEDGREMFAFLRQFLPGVGVCLHGEACSYDNTTDNNFIIDILPGSPDRLLISGLSGHGFKFATVLGEIAAYFAQEKSADFDLSPFSLSRF